MVQLEEEAKTTSKLRENLRRADGLMQQQQKQLKSRAAELQDLEDRLASEAAARQAQSSELTVLRDRCDTLRTQVVIPPSNIPPLLIFELSAKSIM